MSTKKPITPQDIDLFRQTVGAVKRLKTTRREPDPGQILPIPRKQAEDDQAVISELISDNCHATELESGEELFFAQHGVQKSVLRKLRRGQYVVRSELDLHGMSVTKARAAVSDFLSACREQNLSCVRIIHGKGRGSCNRGPVLKPVINHLLQQRRDVLAFSSARAVDGGTGALYVLLKKKAR